MESRNQTVTPSISNMRLFFSSLFVPGVYFMILFSNLVMIAIGCGIMLFMKHMVSIFEDAIQGGVFGVYLLFGFVIFGMLIGLLVSLIGVLSIIFKKKQVEPAIVLNVNNHPRLRSFLEELIGKMNTQMPHSILLHAKSTFFVRDGKQKVLNGVAKGRVLSISMPLLHVLTVDELRWVLAHELAHLTGKDRLFTQLVLPVYKGAVRYIETIDSVRHYKGRKLGLLSIPFILPNLIMKAFVKWFYHVNKNISRIREFRADSVSTELCGTNTFCSALTKIVGYSQITDEVIDQKIGDKLNAGYVYQNYYIDYRNQLETFKKKTEAYIEKVRTDVEDSNSSHPSFSNRLKNVSLIEGQYSNHEKAISLIEQIEEVETDLTGRYSNYLYQISMTD